MKVLLVAACVALLALEAHAGGWRFEQKIAVSAAPAAGVFHHLDGAGRKHIAISDGTVAAIWEDNRGGDPQIHVATLTGAQTRFTPSQQVSEGSEAYEPAIAALPARRFVLAWEQDGAVFARLLDGEQLGPSLLLGGAASGHVSLATLGERVYASWREQVDGRWFVRVAAVETAGARRLALVSTTAVENKGLQTRVLMPSLALTEAGLSVAWEDRRAGHTRLLLSHSADAGKSFSEPQHLNEFFSGRNQYDQGNGVTRVSLAAFAGDEILAAWMDKRRGGFGYGIFAALGSDGGAIFGPNEKVHGAEGDQQPHYNPSTAGNARGDFVVAWDDYRKGDSDIWLSRYNDDDEWDADYPPSPASGAGEQSHPSVSLDAEGRLHLLWMERADVDAPTRLWYSRGKPAKTE